MGGGNSNANNGNMFSRFFSKRNNAVNTKSNPTKIETTREIAQSVVAVSYADFMDPKKYDRKKEYDTLKYGHNHHGALKKGHWKSSSIKSVDTLVDSGYATFDDPKADEAAKKKAFDTRKATLQSIMDEDLDDVFDDAGFSKFIDGEFKPKVHRIEPSKALPPDPAKKRTKPVLSETKHDKALIKKFKSKKAKYEGFGDNYDNMYSGLADYGIPAHGNGHNVHNGHNNAFGYSQVRHPLEYKDNFYYGNNNGDAMYMYLSISLVINIVLFMALICLICCVIVSIYGYMMVKLATKRKNDFQTEVSNDSSVV